MNLLTTRWGTGHYASQIMTISISDGGNKSETTGLHAAPWLDEVPWLAFAMGVLLPMGLLGTGAYYLVRPDKSSPD